MPIRKLWTLRFQMRMEEMFHPEPLMFLLAACYAIGSIDRMLKAGSLVAEPEDIQRIRWHLPKQVGGYLTGHDARTQRDVIRRWGFANGGDNWKTDLATRVASGPQRHLQGEDEFTPFEM